MGVTMTAMLHVAFRHQIDILQSSAQWQKCQLNSNLRSHMKHGLRCVNKRELEPQGIHYHALLNSPDPLWRVTMAHWSLYLHMSFDVFFYHLLNVCQ